MAGCSCEGTWLSPEHACVLCLTLQLVQGASAETGEAMEAEGGSGEENADAVEEVPTKLVTRTVRLVLRAAVRCVSGPSALNQYNLVDVFVAML